MYKSKSIKPYTTLNETIYGNNAIVYHRTSMSDLINRVYTTGFMPGGGAMYGKGFYSTYELKSQQKSDMKHYGDYIVKFQISLENFFFFDYYEFIKSPLYKKLTKKRKSVEINKHNYIQVQFDYFKVGITYKGSSEKFANKKSFSSDIAVTFWKPLKRKGVDGIVFTGRNDGHVLVCYDTKRIIPIAYSDDNGKKFIKVNPKNIEYIKTAFANKQDKEFGKETISKQWKDVLKNAGDYAKAIIEYCENEGITPDEIEDIEQTMHSMEVTTVNNSEPLYFYDSSDIESYFDDYMEGMVDDGIYEEKRYYTTEADDDQLKRVIDNEDLESFLTDEWEIEKIYDKNNYITCDHCKGTGKDPDMAIDLFGKRADCIVCDGRGEVEISLEDYTDWYNKKMKESGSLFEFAKKYLKWKNTDFEEYIDEDILSDDLRNMYRDNMHDYLPEYFSELEDGYWVEDRY